ncbi:MAG TPA: hypothetical protein VMR37_00930 [Rhabdochlamydiaceae bacterium]|nr:hypothetical protein [Rhabdochlamydiaceae bacterium]
MKGLLWIFGIIAFLAGSELFNVATFKEAFSGLTTAFFVLCVLCILALVACQFFLPKSCKPFESSNGGRKCRHWIGYSALGLTFVFILIPHFWMARQLAPERSRFEVVAQSHCEHYVEKSDSEPDHLSTTCGGAIDKELAVRNAILAKHHFASYGDWTVSGQNSDFETTYLYKPF